MIFVPYPWHAATVVDAMLDKGVAAGQAVGSVDAAPQNDPDGHTTGYDAFTGQYKPVVEPKHKTMAAQTKLLTPTEANTCREGKT
jgi:hypothetical protein